MSEVQVSSLSRSNGEVARRVVQRREGVALSHLPMRKRAWGGDGDHQLAANFISLMASKFCTPPPTRLVV